MHGTRQGLGIEENRWMLGRASKNRFIDGGGVGLPTRHFHVSFSEDFPPFAGSDSA